MSHPEPLSPSLKFIYFMMGLTLGAVGAMVILSLARPALPAEAAWVRWLVLAPLVCGALMGWRTARLGAQRQLGLGGALLAALGVGGA